MTTFTGSEAVHLYQAVTIKHGLKLWHDHRIKPNRAWTPTAMMAAATRITGDTFKPRDYPAAIAALEKWIDRHQVPSDQPVDSETPPWE